MFEFSTSLEKCDEEVPNHLDSDSVEEIKRDLMFAIQGENHEKTDTCYLFGIFPNRVVHSKHDVAGDWTAVRATALLLSKANRESVDSNDIQSSVVSQEKSLLSSRSQQQREEDLDNLVRLGDWNGVLMTVSQWEGASDAGSFAVSILNEHQVTAVGDLRSEVEELVKCVIPEEIGE